MPLLKEEDKQHLINEFSSLTTPVKLLVFSQEMECQYCKETHMIVEEVAELSDKISVEVFDFEKDREVAEHYGIDKIPAIVPLQDKEDAKDYHIRLYGIPSGYEFGTLVEDIKMVSEGQSGLSDETKAQLAALAQPLHLQVFITPTCPYCPRAVYLAHQMAMESDLVRGDMVEAIEFPHLSNKYHVQGVPRTVINEVEYLEGAAPEQRLMQKIEEALAG